MIKKITIALTIITIILLLNYTEHHYTREVTVIEVNNQEVTVEDSRGHQWVFFGEDYTVDQEVTVVMYDNTTTKITDDEIVRVKS